MSSPKNIKYGGWSTWLLGLLNAGIFIAVVYDSNRAKEPQSFAEGNIVQLDEPIRLNRGELITFEDSFFSVELSTVTTAVHVSGEETQIANLAFLSGNNSRLLMSLKDESEVTATGSYTSARRSYMIRLISADAKTQSCLLSVSKIDE